MSRLSYIYFLAAVSLFSSASFASNKYSAAIAINEETGAYAFDNDSSSDRTSSDAIKKCEKLANALNKANRWGYSDKERACEVVVQLQRKQCAVLAVSDDAFGWAVTEGKYIQDRTQRDALRYCRKNGGRDCKIVVETCTK